MARDGSGTYTRVVTPPVNGDVADADDYNAEQDDIADALTDSINAAGTKAFGANQSMGGFRLTDLATPSSANDAARKAYVDSAITAAAQPLDATLTALAALSWSSGSPVVQFTAADTVSLTSVPKVTTLEMGDATDTTLSRSAAGKLAVEGVDVILASGAQTVAGIKTLTSNPRIENTTPGLVLKDTDAAVDTKVYLLAANGGTLVLYMQSDAESSFNTALALSRTADSPTLWTFGAPVKARVATSAETSGTLTSASSNAVVVTTAGVTINDGVHTAGDVIVIYNNSASNVTITQDTGMTLRLHGSTSTGNRTLLLRGMMSVYFVSASEAVCSGDVT